LPYNGELNEEVTQRLFPCSGGGQGGGTRLSGGGSVWSVLAWGGRRRPTRPGGPEGRVGWLATGLIGPEAKKILSK
jgi:hypothetical protein